MEKFKSFIFANQVVIIAGLMIGVIALGYKVFIHDKK
jgi:hypothetical protein